MGNYKQFMRERTKINDLCGTYRLKTSQVFEVGTETMKMARIAGLDYARTTDLMTSALRGFNMEVDEVSAKRINDVYSVLAARSAANTEEIANAMTKTASIAHSANMEFETTAAFLTTMIETTREASENLGTAMKTVVARFTEMKKDPSGIGEVDGEIVDANRIETALNSVDIALRKTNGEFRDLDDVFMEISEKWDTMSNMQQRYIATMAAGSRQQSRFIAMVANHSRTMELYNYAMDSAGASNDQFEKTLDSMEAKLNGLKSSWESFTMGLAPSGLLKMGVDGLTQLLSSLNALTDPLGAVGTGLKILMTGGSLVGGGRLMENLIGGVSRSLKARGEGASILQTLMESLFYSRGGELEVWTTGTKLGSRFLGGFIEKLMLSESAIAQSLAQILGSLGPLGYATGALIAVSLGKALYDKLWNYEKRAKEFRDRAEKQELEARQGEDELEDLVGSREELDNLTNSFQELTVGTSSWNETLQESNDQVLRLIEKFPELAAFTSLTKDGRLEISVDGWEEAEAALRNEIEELKRGSRQDRAAALGEDLKGMGTEAIYKTTGSGNTYAKFIQVAEVMRAYEKGALAVQDYAKNAGIAVSDLESIYFKHIADWKKYRAGTQALAQESLMALREDFLEEHSEEFVNSVQNIILKAVKDGMIEEIDDDSLSEISEDLFKTLAGVDERLLDLDNLKLSDLEELTKSGAFTELRETLHAAINESDFGDLYREYLETLEAEARGLRKSSREAMTTFSGLLGRKMDLPSHLVDTDMLQGMGSAISRAAGQGGPKAAKELVKVIEEVFSIEGLEIKGAKDFITALNSLDFSKASDVKEFDRLMREAGLLDGQIDNLATRIEELGLTSDLVTFEHLQQELESLINLRQKVKDGTTEFSEEDYQELIESYPKLEKGFIKNYLDNTYEYLGEDLIDIVNEGILEGAKRGVAKAHEEVLAAQELEQMGEEVVSSLWDMKDQIGEDTELDRAKFEDELSMLQEVFGLTQESMDLMSDEDIILRLQRLLDVLAQLSAGEDPVAEAERTYSGVQSELSDKTVVGMGWESIEAMRTGEIEAAEKWASEIRKVAEEYDVAKSSIDKVVDSLKNLDKNADSKEIGKVVDELKNIDNIIGQAKWAEQLRAIEQSVYPILDALLDLEEGTAEFDFQINEMANTLSEIFGEVISPEAVAENLESIYQFAEGLISEAELMTTLTMEETNAAVLEILNNLGFTIEDLTTWINEQRPILEAEGYIDISEMLANMGVAGEEAQNLAEYIAKELNASVDWVSTGYKTFELPYSKLDPTTFKMTGEVGTTKINLPTAKTVITKGGGGGVSNYVPPNSAYGGRGGGRGGGSGGGGGGGGKAEKDWLNPYDRFYNLLEQISEAERQRVKLQQEYNRELENGELNIAKVLDLRKQEITNLYEQKRLQEELLKGRRTQLAKIAAEYHTEGEVSKSFSSWGVTQYGRYDKQAGVVVIDWSGLEKIKDTELGGAAQAYISRLEELSSGIEGIEDAIEALHDDIKATLEKHRDDYLTLEQQLLEGLIKQQQRVIDNLSDLHDAITNSQQEMISTMQEQIDLQRQIRDNTKIEEDIAEKEARLQYLRQDPSGGNQLEIMRLEKEIDQARQDHSDNLIDQHMNELQRQNDQAAEQRALQIEIAQAHLDHMTASGAFWPEIETTLKSALNGEIWAIDRIRDIMMVKDDVDAMSTFGTKDWERKWTTQVESALAGLQSWAKDEEEWRKAAAKAVSTSSKTTATPAKQEITTSTTQSSSSASGPGLSPSNKSGNQETKTTTTTVIRTLYEHRKKQTPVMFSGGGYTGDWFGNEGRMAMLHKKELVFDATDSANLIELKDTLRGLKRSSSNSFGDSPLNQYFEIFIDAAIASDYDAARLGEQLQQKFQDYGAYRNVPVLGKLR